jgi:hypothetical protein
VAATAEGRALTQQHRSAQLAIRSGVLRDVQQLWQTVDPADLSHTIRPFADASSVLVRDGNRRSAALAGRYVDQLRQAERVRGALAILAGDPPRRHVIAGALRGSALRGIITARQAGFSLDAAARRGFVRAAGSASSLVLDGGRQVVEETVRADRHAVGWMRVTSADPCAFCASLAAEGPTKSREIHAFHDHDGCSVEPVYDEGAFKDRSQWPAESVRHREAWDEITGGADFDESGAREAFRRGLEERAEAVAQGRDLPAVDPTIGVDEF